MQPCNLPAMGLQKYFQPSNLGISSLQSLSRVQLFATPWTVAHQASLVIPNSQSLLKLMSIESMMPSNYLILCHPHLLPSVFPDIRVFSNESSLRIRWLKYWSFNLTSVLPMNVQGWFPLGLTGLKSFLSKGPSRVFSNTTVQKHQFFSAQLFLIALPIWSCMLSVMLKRESLTLLFLKKAVCKIGLWLVYRNLADKPLPSLI